MSAIAERGRARQREIRASLQAQYPSLFPKQHAPLARVDRSAIVLGRNPAGQPVYLPQRPRLEHAHVIGTTGGGKSKFLEHNIRQDIANGHGILVIDPHGEHPQSLYRSTLAWLDQKAHGAERIVHLVDPNAPTHTVGFNPLARPDPDTDLSVVAGVTLEAFSRAWGGEDTTNKPTIERVLTAVFTALADLELTLVEAPLLLDRKDRHGLRAHAIKTVADRYTRDELQRLHELSIDERRRHDYDLEVVGPINRIARFVRPPAIRAMAGQTERVINFRDAMDEGHVILCNLSGGSRVYERDADLLGRLITRALFFHAKRRRNPERPFYVYLDECHRYLSGDLENILAEVRKYGIGVVLSHQWLGQLAVESDNMLAAVRNATNLKVVFRLKDPAEAEDLAHMVVPLDLEMPVRALVKPTVVGHRIRHMKGEQFAEQRSTTDTQIETAGQSTTIGRAVSESFALAIGESESETITHGSSHTEGWGRSHSTNESAGSGWSDGENWSIGSSTADALSRSRTSGSSRGSQRSAQGTVTGPSDDDRWRQRSIPNRYFNSATLSGISRSEDVQSSEALAIGATRTTGSNVARGGSSGRTYSSSTGSSSGRSRSVQDTKSFSIATTRGSSRTTTHTVGVTESIAESTSRSLALGTGKTQGTSQGHSTQEALEPIYANLPGSVHSLENVKYMAAQTLRGLATGQGFLNYVGASGMTALLLTVPNVTEHPLTEAAFAQLRERMLSRSSAATPIADAELLVSRREDAVLRFAQANDEDCEPASFRTKAPVSAPKPEQPRPAVAGRGRTRTTSQRKSLGG